MSESPSRSQAGISRARHQPDRDVTIKFGRSRTTPADRFARLKSETGTNSPRSITAASRLDSNSARMSSSH